MQLILGQYRGIFRKRVEGMIDGLVILENLSLRLALINRSKKETFFIAKGLRVSQ